MNKSKWKGPKRVALRKSSYVPLELPICYYCHKPIKTFTGTYRLAGNFCHKRCGEKALTRKP
jgi:hypothetical protein